MAHGHELCFSLSFRKSTLFVVFVYLVALHFSNCDVQCNKQAGPCEAITALGEQSDVKSLHKHWTNQELDESTLVAFPILRHGHLEVLNIPEEIWSNYSEQFGMELLGIEELEKIDEIIRNNPETANVRIFLQWFSGKGLEPITCRTLVYVLNKIGFNELASEIKATCEFVKIIDVPYKPQKVKKYSQLLSGKYGNDAVIDSTLWLPKTLHGRNITFVDLELKEKGSDILLVDLLGDLRSGTRILLLGRPGVGKTTITRHLSKKLINAEHFYLVIKVHLGVAGEIDSLDSLIQASVLQASAYKNPDDISIISNYISRTLGKGVCFLVDGFDEYVGSGYIAGLVAGNRLAESTVIVTSRPSAAEDIKIFFHKVVEIIGFGEKGMQAYLEQLKLSDADYQIIDSYLKAHPNVRQLCYLPLHLSMLVYVAVHDTLSLVDTETRLYSDFLSLTIKQYESVRHKQTVEFLQECFNDVYREIDLCVLLQKISKVSFEGIMSRDQVFNSTSFGKLPDSINVSAELEALSLFKVEKIYGRRGNKLFRYYYSHPTFQEFLAAFHLTTLPREEQLNYTRYYWMHDVYKFFLGLIGSELDKKFDKEIVFQTFVSYARKDLATYQHQELHIMKCAHEIGQSSQFTTFLQAVGVINNGNSIQVDAGYKNHDCWYVGYTLTRSPWYEIIVEKHFQLGLCLSFITNYLKHDLGSVDVTKLSLGNYYSGYWPWFTEREDSVSSDLLLKFLPAFHEDLVHLKLTFLKFEHGSSVLQLGEILRSFKKLQFLALSVNISVIKEGYLESALRGLANLEHLELGVVSKHDDDTAIPGDLLEFKGLKQLKSLTLCISWNKEVVDVNMTALIGGLVYLTELQELSIHIILYGGFREDGASELLQGLERVPQLHLTLHLDLCSEYGLGNVTTEEVAVVLRNMTSLKNLSLCINFYFSGIQGHSGLIELAEGLKGLAELQELSLELKWEVQENEDIDEAAIALVDGLKHLHSSLSVLELYLQQNGSCSEVSSLFASLSNLHELKFKWSSPGGKTDVTKLMLGLEHLRQLKKLDLSWNKLGSDDMFPLIEVLKHLSYLHTFDLSNNEIGDTGVQLLAELIDSGYLTHLQVLRLNHNIFSDTGAEILSRSVVKLYELHTLDFGLALGRYSAQALIQIQGLKSSLSNSMSSCDFDCVTIGEIFALVGGFSTGISVLVGGLLCCLVFKFSLAISTRKRALLPEGFYDNLAQSTFSASCAWNLELLRNQGLDGRGTVIAILDTTIDLNCPAFLQENIVMIDKLPGVPIASMEHGCICAAVAVGSSYYLSPTTIFPSGVAPGAQLIMYRIAEGKSCSDVAVLAALDDMRKKIASGIQIDVTSISYDLKKDNAEEIHRKMKALAGNRVVFVAAAGNRGRYQAHASIPAIFEDCVLSVGALDKDGFKSRFNACGRVDVSAPGENIPAPFSSSKYEGTSFAAPAIGGLVLLLKQCANMIGPPASENIHDVRILRYIFAEHMTIESDSGEEVLDPAGFFQSVLDDPQLLNKIIMDYLNTPMDQ